MYRIVIMSAIWLIGSILFLSIFIKKKSKSKSKLLSKLLLRALFSGIILGLTLAGMTIAAGTEFLIPSIVFGICGFFVGIFAILSQQVSYELYGKRLIPYLIEKLKWLSER